MTLDITLENAVEKLPTPLNREEYSLLKTGIYDCEKTRVYLNAAKDFAFLHPIPQTDYTQYQPRQKTLRLTTYKKKLQPFQKRLSKMAKYFTSATNLLEIGASDAEFLSCIHDRYPQTKLSCLEPDTTTKLERNSYSWLTEYEKFEDLIERGYRFDLVCMFHVFEHILDTKRFLSKCRQLVSSEGKIVIEIPSLTDPLLSIYKVKLYEDFYFQKQHPYVYSLNSIARVLEANNFTVDKTDIIPYQRYGLENHLTWILTGKPGGNEYFRTLFEASNRSYIEDLERAKITDTVIVIAKVKS